jgi:yeast amino acid transporter
VGVEVVAATAQEAKLDDDIQPDDFPTQDGQVSRESRTCDPFHLPAVLVPVTAMFIYLWGGWIVTQNVEWNDERLPKWIKSNNDDSVFVLSAKQYSPWLGKGLTVLLVINVLSTSSTALFVASRTLFGLTRDLDTRTLDPWLRWLAVFGQKSKYDVPWPAVLASSWLIWVPFLKYLAQNTFETVSFAVSTS